MSRNELSHTFSSVPARKKSQVDAALQVAKDRSAAATELVMHEARAKVRIAAHLSDGAMALAGHIMERAVHLDRLRQVYSGDDPITSAMLADFQAIAMQQAKGIQVHLYDGWDF